MTHELGTVIPFPGRPENAGDGERRFLLRTASLLRALAVDRPDSHDLLHLHTAMDLRRPHIRRLLSDRGAALAALERVSDRVVADPIDQVRAAQKLAALLEDAATASEPQG
jgi:hypothetical protein